jgi:hypothetical protein
MWFGLRACNACRNSFRSCIFATPQPEREESPRRSLSKSPNVMALIQMDFVPDGFRSSSPICPATQWVSMHPFCLGLATTSARAALRLKAGRSLYASARYTHHISGEQSFTPTSAGFSVSNRILYQFDVERHEDASRHGEALERIEPSGQHCFKASSTNQNSKPRNKSLTIRPATGCRRTELMIEKRARLMASSTSASSVSGASRAALA